MKIIKSYSLFFGSIGFGLLIWMLSYIILPLTPVEPLKAETVFFIGACYLALVVGFLAFNFHRDTSKKYVLSHKKTVKLLLIIIIASYLLRWYDLFYIRDLSFINDLKFNRILNEKNFKENQVLLIIASVLKSLYFFPFVICIRSNLSHKKFYVLASYLVLFFPIVEAVLKGNRKPFFEIFLIVAITVIAYQRKQINFKRIGLAVLAVFLMMTISMLILFKREKLSENLDAKFYESMFESRYNEILRPTEKAINYFQNDENSVVSKLFALSIMHTGQYIAHGVFELNHIINMDNLPITYGKYNFSTIPKFLNKTNLANIEITNPSPRDYVYLTLFGSFYIDFRWFTPVFLFVFGVLQKYIYQRALQSFIYTPILIYVLIINVFLMILSYTRGAGIYTFFSFVFLLFLLRIFEKNLYEKSVGP